jgi:hypothetical protein
MYKIEIDISGWGGDEKVTIETSDFDKIELIREFIEFQQENGWAADYEHVVDFEEDEADAESVSETTDEQTSDIQVAVFIFDDKEKTEAE